MNQFPVPPPPPPFGDPARVRGENAQAVRKGVLFGCGGCGLMGFCVLAFVAGVLAIVFSAMHHNDVCKEAFSRAQSSPEVQAILGQPVEKGWFITGSINSSAGEGSANLWIPISGPQGSASIHVIARKEDSVWIYKTMSVVTKPANRSVNLLRTPTA